jgi:hypothetical protein
MNPQRFLFKSDRIAKGQNKITGTKDTLQRRKEHDCSTEEHSNKRTDFKPYRMV